MRRVRNHMLLGSLLLISLPACRPDAPPPAGEIAQQDPEPQLAEPRAAAPAATKSDAIRKAINDALRAQYAAGYDEANRCWRTERGEGDEAAAYCMRPLPEQVVQQGDASLVYVALASASDIRGNPDYIYGQPDVGVMDAFKLHVAADGTPAVVARGVGLAFGSAGDCGCANAKFVQLGPRTHGWMFTSGGTWQGHTVASHVLVAPVGGTFKDVAAFPRYVEGDPSVEYRIAIAPANGDWYPLRLSQWRGDRHVRDVQIEFDPASARYKLPDAF